ncbi:NAD-binding protein, partial [Arthrospira platensis SPKY1]|nr:NAD-binding protein [Arthrospira platensis SPKY1]
MGGEFGFALLAIALNAGTIETGLGQIALTAVLFSIIAGPLVIRYNLAIASWIVRSRVATTEDTHTLAPSPDAAAHLERHVIICGYGRIGQSVAHFLQEENIPFIALDLDPVRVREAHAAG